MLCAASTTSAATRADELARLSQQFSDASASGDAQTLAALLDDHVTFMLEDGRLVTKKEIVDSTAPAGPNHPRLVQSDFAVRFYERVAVTSFTDTSTFDFHGQVLRNAFKSTEVWRQDSHGWKMISSQTSYVVKDPPSIALSLSTLDEYVGRYRFGDDYTLTISRQDDGLIGTVSTGQTFPIEAEARDVLFTPGQPMQRRFVERDRDGRVIGLISRRLGNDLMLRKEG